MERGIILSTDSRIALGRAMPEASDTSPEPSAEADPTPGASVKPRVLGAEEMIRFERENIVRALEDTGWRVAGKDGAAVLLGLPPSTLSSRMKALGIRRPR